MNEEPRYNETYYEFTQFNSCIIDLDSGSQTNLADISAPICWKDIFGNGNPVEIEVGCGKGRFLLESARRCPEINYLGVERAPKYVRRTQQRFRKHAKHTTLHNGELRSVLFQNVRLAWTDAARFVDFYVAERCVQAYHVYFPDPWPKKRQHKRRLFRNETWLRGVERTLRPCGGRLHIATDYSEYFDEIRHRLDQSTCLVETTSATVQTDHVQTNFEMKYLAEGREIYRAVFEKPDLEDS
ncbi:MAG: tRNA (guanosine(46)-N7)-methyltransferase TrmB [Candidatus Poribacteria bacterium]|nr:tRNA (guanosine(46)-N7)-methyltransferase TrmB [Candidatus Poribacteria bacterium]MDE0502617.1 tRNA (guanosine(46)-N7)-methyltransferase TrmB [Candidatus Poribacteria bacterium]